MASMLVLASASPRRQELLRHAGISFVVQPADIDESPQPGEPLATPRTLSPRYVDSDATSVASEPPVKSTRVVPAGAV